MVHCVIFMLNLIQMCKDMAEANFQEAVIDCM